MKISILFANSKKALHKPGGYIIRLVEKTDFEHIAIMAEFKGANYIYHAVWPKVKRNSIPEFSEDYDLVHKYDFEIDDDERAVYNYLQILAGVKYSLAQLILIFLRRVSSVVHKASNGWILNHENSLICSEIAAMILSDFLGVKFESKLDSIGLIEIKQACDDLKNKGV